MITNNSNEDQPQSPDQTEPPNCPTCSCTGHWRWFIIAAIAILIIVMFTNRFSSQSEPDTPSIIWGHDYQAALQQAKDQNKPLLLAFHASWCPPCREMKRTTYHNSEVIDFSESFVRVIIDFDTQDNLVNQYNIQGIPAYVILNSDGTTIKSFGGYYTPADFLAKLKSAI